YSTFSTITQIYREFTQAKTLPQVHTHTQYPYTYTHTHIHTHTHTHTHTNIHTLRLQSADRAHICIKSSFKITPIYCLKGFSRKTAVMNRSPCPNITLQQLQ